MSQFIDFLVGTFANKVQAQSHPTRYAHIRVSHRLIGENRIYGEQAYNYLLNRPYRQFVIDVVEESEEEYEGELTRTGYAKDGFVVDEESDSLTGSEEEELFFEDGSEESAEEIVNRMYNTRSKNRNSENTVFTGLT